MADKPRRNPLEVEHFLEGNRQKWALFYSLIGLMVMGLTAYGEIKDPSPFLGYFTGIGVTFILGASASSVMAAYKMESRTVNENVTTAKTEHSQKVETVTETVTRNENESIHSIEEKMLTLTRVDPKDIDEEAFE